MTSAHPAVFKVLLRDKLRKLVRQIPPASRKAKSKKILNQLMRSKDYKKSKNLGVYVSLPFEVSTKEFIGKALKQGKRIFIPKVNSGTKQISFFSVTNLKKDLVRGEFGIDEPKTYGKKPLNPSRLELMIVPGLGFDQAGRRLGRGEGYFDRLLKKAKRVKKIGLAFREQILEEIPIEKHDVLMDKVISD